MRHRPPVDCRESLVRRGPEEGEVLPEDELRVLCYAGHPQDEWPRGNRVLGEGDHREGLMRKTVAIALHKEQGCFRQPCSINIHRSAQ